MSLKEVNGCDERKRDRAQVPTSSLFLLYLGVTLVEETDVAIRSRIHRRQQVDLSASIFIY